MPRSYIQGVTGQTLQRMSASTLPGRDSELGSLVFFNNNLCLMTCQFNIDLQCNGSGYVLCKSFFPVCFD